MYLKGVEKSCCRYTQREIERVKMSDAIKELKAWRGRLVKLPNGGARVVVGFDKGGAFVGDGLVIRARFADGGSAESALQAAGFSRRGEYWKA